MPIRYLSSFLALAGCSLPGQHESPVLIPRELTLEQIMADPDWIGREPESPYWADDSQSVYFAQKEAGSDERDLHRVQLEGSKPQLVLFEDLGLADESLGDYNRERTQKLYSRHGDLFLRDFTSGQTLQLTRTHVSEINPSFLANPDRFTFQRDQKLFVRVLSTGMEYQPAELKLEDEPELERQEGFLAEQQERLFESIRDDIEEREARRDRKRAIEDADPTRAPRPWYLGEGQTLVDMEISPDERWLILVLRDETDSAQPEQMPDFVTESGLLETEGVRPNVGKISSRAVKYVLLDLLERERLDLSLRALPSLTMEAAEEDDPVEPDAEPELRRVTNLEMRWAPDSSRAACMVRALDNKDRWIFTVEPGEKEVRCIHHLRDDAWINFRFNEWNWAQGGESLYFTSEESGWSQLYLWSRATNEVRALTSGEFEVDSVGLDPLSDTIYFRANAVHPGIHEVYRVPIAGGEMEQLTNLGGRIVYQLSPNSEKLLLTHSKALEPPDLYWQRAEPGAEVHRLTNTTTDEFRTVEWTAPQFVTIPSRAETPIHARLYQPQGDTTSEPRPAVLFIHGAGYLQNAHAGWSNYFREFMFHSLLVQQGYVVLDMDFRASSGYGRDWRTATYLNMGTPELEDMADGVQWLAENHSVDAKRVGVYGGSYGGFLTLMALFKKPDLFACGAALRPVTDWAHYNHAYTSNILNTPEKDPEAYLRSSPIEFAEGLDAPLLICHGMVDSNVLVKDSIRLAQRLIELQKENWELALFPVEGHRFDEASSWHDEYRRIYELFEENLK